MADAVTTASVAIGAALLALQLKKEAKAQQEGQQPAPPPAPSPAAPQERPGPVDSGGPAIVYALPPGMTAADVADYYARQGRAHDAGTVINVYQGGSPITPERQDGDGTPLVSPSPEGSGVPLDGTAPTTPATPGAPPAPSLAPAVPEEPTHEDVFGRTQPGPPSGAEVAAKAALGYGGGLVLETVGTAKIATDAAKAGSRVGAAGPVLAGAGLGLQATQLLQDVGFFDEVVKPAGAAFSERVGPQASKAVATAALPLSVTGAVVKAALRAGGERRGERSPRVGSQRRPRGDGRRRHAGA